jgi:site-specific DNA-methyltransferase (adenine-specific)
MELMANLKDKEIDLAIVDPPYGISVGVNGIVGVNKAAPCKQYKPVRWDYEIPDSKYFSELFRVSKNQIIWGGNYFIEHLKNTSCFIFWDKDNSGNFADGELAWTSFKTAIRVFKFRWNGMLQENMKSKEIRIHPTHKPVKLYEWLLTNYAKPNDLILDTHCGSASSLIACENLGFKYIASELDKDYYHQSLQRLEAHLAQGKLFQRSGATEFKEVNLFE